MKENRMVAIPEYGDLMSLSEFGEACRNNWLIDDDGFGLWATETEMLDDHTQAVYPSDCASGRGPKEGFTHIVWFNK